MQCYFLREKVCMCGNRYAKQLNFATPQCRHTKSFGNSGSEKMCYQQTLCKENIQEGLYHKMMLDGKHEESRKMKLGQIKTWLFLVLSNNNLEDCIIDRGLGGVFISQHPPFLFSPALVPFVQPQRVNINPLLK